jgi:hypothetical protein
MNKQTIFRDSALVILIMILTSIFGGCKTSSAIQTQVTITPSMQSTQIIASQTKISATNTPEITISPKSSISPTESPYPTSTLTPTLIPSMTALPILPTLSPSEAEALIKDLLVNNAGCKLSCWWGIVPGKTAWNVADQFLSTFSTIEGPAIQPRGSITYEAYSAHFNISAENYIISLINANDIVDNIGLSPDVTIFGHQLNSLLTNNGQPEEVWVAPMPDTPGGSWYYLVISYPAQGIMARYGGSATPSITLNSNGEAIINSLQICPIGVGPELWLVPPNTLKGVKGNSALGGTAFTDLLIPIQQATGMSVEEFYKTFRTGDNSTCFDTPSESWP